MRRISDSRNSSGGDLCGHGISMMCKAKKILCWIVLLAIFLISLTPTGSLIASGIQQGLIVLARTGNTNTYATSTGALTNGDCVKIDVNGNLVDNGTTCAGAGASQLHSIGFVIDGGGSVIATGDAKVYPTADFNCTINRWDISADQSGSITVDVWKAAGAIPTSGNKISASAPLTLSAAQLAQNGSRTGWTPAVSVGDVFGFSVATVATVTRITGQVWCQ